MHINCPHHWSFDTFKLCDLGDLRRRNRLIKMAGNLAGRIGSSVVKSGSSIADSEGAYRLLRNPNVHVQDIAEGAYLSTVEKAASADTLLALEDTTDLTYCHSVTDELGPIGSSLNHKARGILAHSVLLVDADNNQSLGLIEQQRWIRNQEEFYPEYSRRVRPYEDKESYKWEEASRLMVQRLGSYMDKTISVCDRGADIFEYLKYKTAHQQRFVVRACWNRKLASTHNLFDSLEHSTALGHYEINVQQRGGRQQSIKRIKLSMMKAEIRPPKGKRREFDDVKVNTVICQEEGSSTNPLQWVLLTSEPVTDYDSALTIVKYYQMRWKIEELHKAWKSGGTRVEHLRMQSFETLEKMAVILVFVATRLLQLRELGEDKATLLQPCTQVMSKVQWKLLWAKYEKKRAPRKPPSVQWAYHKLGRLGGWTDSKRTGRVGWNALWDGWFILESMVEGYELSQQLKM